MKVNRKILKSACYTVSVTMALVGNVPPLLFLTFREMYGISFSLLGLLVVVNFATQLGIDLVFSFFSEKFDIPKTVRTMPILTVVGLVIFALVPTFFPKLAYVGLVIGTILCALSSGLAEVLISPIIASLPADDPEREMSALHSVYAWGVVGVVIFSTLFLLVFGKENWNILMLLFIIIPVLSSVLYSMTDITCVESEEGSGGLLGIFKNPLLWLSVIAIFLGGASEVTMGQWSSSYLEHALGIDKVWGDVFGVAFFGMTLGIGRTLYAKRGKNLTRVILIGAIGASACYIIAVVSSIPVIGLIACALTGYFTAMMWPGNLSIATERFASGGVVVFALMAAGGDMGAAVAPQLVGVISDAFAVSNRAYALAQQLGISAEQLGMRAGILAGAIFPILGVIVISTMRKYFNNKDKINRSEVKI